MQRLKWRVRLAVAVAAAAIIPIASASSASAATPPFTQCPAVGYDTSCEVLIEKGENGELESFTDPTQGPFDGDDDTVIGVQNNSKEMLTHIKLTGENLFGFDGDGLCDYVGDEFEGFHGSPEGCPFGEEGVNPETGLATGGIYEGPNNVYNVTSVNEGEVVFTPEGIPPGGHTYFSLEDDIVGFKCQEDGCHQKPEYEPCETAVGLGHSGPRGPGGFNEDNSLNVDKQGKEQFEVSFPGRSPHVRLTKLAEAICEEDVATGDYKYFYGAGPARVGGQKGYYELFEIAIEEGRIYVAVEVVNSSDELIAYDDVQMNPKSKQTIQ